MKGHCCLHTGYPTNTIPHNTIIYHVAEIREVIKQVFLTEILSKHYSVALRRAKMH